MIAHLSGKLFFKEPPFIIININGIGYEVEVSMQTYYHLPNIGEAVELWIQAHYREDNQLLFGFWDKDEKIVFNQLVKVNGIGMKTALAILSVLSLDDLVMAIEHKNIALLSSVPGIGKKTAERLALELKDKLKSAKIDNTDASIEHYTDDIIQTLMALGYNQKEAYSAAKNLPPNLDIGESVKLALQKLSK